MTERITVGQLYFVGKKAVSKWVDDKAMKMSAALAYNTIIAIAPLLMVALLVFTLLYKQDAGTQIKTQLGALTDPRMADSLSLVIQAAMDRVDHAKSITLTSISLVVSIFGASGVFGELQDSLNTIWGVKPVPNRGIVAIVKDRVQPILLVCGIAFLLLASTIVSTAIDAVSGALIKNSIGTSSFTAKMIGYLIDIVISLLVLTGLFTAMFKVLPDVEIGFRDTLLGGFVTAVLFEIGKYALSVYMGFAAPGSTFGIAGSIIVFLVWINYSAYILFFGAEFTQVYATLYGSKVKIADNAEPVAEDKLATHHLEVSDAALAARPIILPRPKRVFVPQPDLLGRRVAFTVVPALAGTTLLRLTIKRMLVKQPTGSTLTAKWKKAGRSWWNLVSLKNV